MGSTSRPISRNLAEISIAYVIGKREASVYEHEAIFTAYRSRINMARIAQFLVPGLPHHVT